jgi:high affinity sulfate transporter 1
MGSTDGTRESRQLAKARFAAALPILRWLPAYHRAYLSRDLLAGAIVAALLVPQSLGYAAIAGVPVEVGLYAIPLALVAYAVFGSSPQLIVGPVSTVAIVSGSIVVGLAEGRPAEAIAITGALAVTAGVVLVAVGLLRVGWVAEFLSKPIVTGFVFGLSLTIVVGELPTLFGIPRPEGDLIGVLIGTVQELDSVQWLTVLISAVSLLVLFLGRAFAPRVPWGLLILVAGIVLSTLLDFADRGVAVIGDIPPGLPALGVPTIDASLIGAVLLGGLSIALVGLAEGLSAARLFATKGGYTVTTDRELVAMGAANLAAGVSGGLGVAGSLSKTAAAAESGCRTQVASLTSAALVVVVLVTATQHMEALPRAVLSAIVVVAVWGLMDVAGLRRFRAIRKADFVAAMVALAGVVLFGPLLGLGIAIGTSLLTIIYRSSRPQVEVMGKISGEKAAWGRLNKHPERKPVAGVVVVRLDAPLFWANATAVEQDLLAEVGARPGTRALLLDLEATTRLDTTTVDVLSRLLTELRERGVDLFLVRVLHTAQSVLVRAGFIDELGPDHVWHSISQGVRAARKLTGLKKYADEALTEPEEPEELVGTPDEERLAVDGDWELADGPQPDGHHRDGSRAERERPPAGAGGGGVDRRSW